MLKSPVAGWGRGGSGGVVLPSNMKVPHPARRFFFWMMIVPVWSVLVNVQVTVSPTPSVMDAVAGVLVSKVLVPEPLTVMTQLKLVKTQGDGGFSSDTEYTLWTPMPVGAPVGTKLSNGACWPSAREKGA